MYKYKCLLNNEYYGVKITPMSLFNIHNFPNEYFLEVNLLSKFVGNNFIQKLVSSFHDYDNLYFVSKFYEGFIINHLDTIWNENKIKFFSACLIQSLISLRKEQLIHRDIHFGNLVLDEKQYINLIDFHIAIEYKNKDDPKNNFIGSPVLCAPEMIEGLNYDYNSDYYRLGGMIYFSIFRNYPNIIKQEKNITDIIINYKETKNYSISCIDFINKLIITDKKKRIGFNNIYELKKHDFFKNFNWRQLIDGKMRSPFPKITLKSLGLCKSLFNFTKKIFISTELLKNNTFRNIFFTYDNINNAIIDKIFKSFKYNLLRK